MPDANANDPWNLNRFLSAQDENYGDALSELKAGRKQSHWMWYVFPQIDGLGFSSTSKFYAIKTLEEAKAYLQHPILGARLLECAEAVMAIEGRKAIEIFGSPDDMKLRSCATLFASLSPGSVFGRILDRFFNGNSDDKTLHIMQRLKEKASERRD